MKKALDRFIEQYDQYPNFSYTKINHGYWEKLAESLSGVDWPETIEQKIQADIRYQQSNGNSPRRYWEDGLVDELDVLLKQALAAQDPSLSLNFGLSAWPNDNAILGTPHSPEKSVPFLESMVGKEAINNDGGLVLKLAIHDFSFDQLIDRLQQENVLLVGPGYLKELGSLFKLPRFEHIQIHPSNTCCMRHMFEDEIVAALERFDNHGVVLLQAATIGTYWMLKLRQQFPNVRWIDGGLSLSISNMDDLLRRPWGQVYRKELVAYYNHLAGKRVYDEQLLEPELATLLKGYQKKSSKQQLQLLCQAYRYLGQIDDDNALQLLPNTASLRPLLGQQSAHQRWACPDYLIDTLAAAELGELVSCPVNDAGQLDLQSPQVAACDGLIWVDLNHQPLTPETAAALNACGQKVVLFHLAGIPAKPFAVAALLRIYNLSELTLLGADNLILVEHPSKAKPPKQDDLSVAQRQTLVAHLLDLPRRQILALMQKRRLENLLQRAAKVVTTSSDSALVIEHSSTESAEIPAMATFTSQQARSYTVLATAPSMANYSEQQLLNDWQQPAQPSNTSAPVATTHIAPIDSLGVGSQLPTKPAVKTPKRLNQSHPLLNFVIIGAQKCGTTALDYFLRQHAEVCMPADKKELHYFYDEQQNHDYSLLEQQFQPSEQTLACGEATPAYLRYEHAMAAIARYNPDMKLICLLRDPIARANSHWNMLFRNNVLQGDVDFLDFAIDDYRSLQPVKPGLLERGLYAQQLQNVLKYFSADQLLLLKHDDLLYRHQDTLNRVFDFIGVEHQQIPGKPVNKKPHKTQLSIEQRQFLRGFYFQDTDQLGRQFDIDVEDWLQV
ncbi:sulfotransferase [Neiella sp. HB171785]|uniref:Sulfotransferase n=1 Tax=Neiella litorisoli TaxID=2771431 RepID=A0A8J6QU42_9GAMM|nr:sulfotransferase [Neiella litorisoli]